jgi:hypothetical protein
VRAAPAHTPMFGRIFRDNICAAGGRKGLERDYTWGHLFALMYFPSLQIYTHARRRNGQNGPALAAVLLLLFF